MRSLSKIPAFIFLLLTINATAQKASISASVDKNKILIGEPLTLIVQAQIPVASKIRFPFPDSIPHFERAGEVRVDSTIEGSYIALRVHYQLTSFDSGHWVIPSFVLARGIASDTLPVDVVFSDFDPKQPYHELRDIIPVEAAEEEQEQWWYFIAAGVLLLAFILYLIFRRKPVKEQVASPFVNPYEHAKKQLDELKRNKPIAREYYSALTEIFKVYVADKKGIRSLQNTTGDLVLQLHSLYPREAVFEKLAQSLRLADFVKFAKYVPGAEDDQAAFEAVSRAIDQIERQPDAV